MNVVNLSLIIEETGNAGLVCLVNCNTENVRLSYSPETRIIGFEEYNSTAEIIEKNRLQFNKIIQSTLKRKVFPGQNIDCVFIEDFPFMKEADFSRYIRVDRRSDPPDIHCSDKEMGSPYRIFADGSFAEMSGQAGYGGLIEDPRGNQETYSRSYKGGSSNLMELLAVTEGLIMLDEIEKVQINTDSRFVIRGLIQWVHFWKHNNWQTAYGSKVKFVEEWQRLDGLCEGKLLEFHWIKGHSGHEKQTYSHQLAQQGVK